MCKNISSPSKRQSALYTRIHSSQICSYSLLPSDRELERKPIIDKASFNSTEALQVVPDEVTNVVAIIVIDTKISKSLIHKDASTCQHLESQQFL